MPAISDAIKKIQITSGLEIATSPDDASTKIRNLVLDETAVRYGKDFRIGDWSELFNAI